MTRFFALLLIFGIARFASILKADHADDPPAPLVDRVGFPERYQESYSVLRRVDRPEKKQMITVYGNKAAASIARVEDLPYPNGSVIVMETSDVLTDDSGKPRLDEKGRFRKDKVVGLHVMRREKGFGEAYGKNRTGDWEYVEYRPDGTTITPPKKSFACAECHVKAGRERDFVFQGRFPAQTVK